MPRSPGHAAPRKRRTADEARAAILDAAERRLVASGPTAIRLQEVAAEVGVSHPTVLHHFGSREALVEAVVARALDSLHADLMRAVQSAPESEDRLESLLDAVFETLVTHGHGRTFLWLMLSGYAPKEDLRVRSLAEAVHAVRRVKPRKQKKAPPFEDTYYSVLLPALAMLSMSVAGDKVLDEGAPLGPRGFRRWLAKLLHEHYDKD
ncbi:MAG TPA: TetR/AcrR family transcriptional regulator [Polyangiaceae bacterium]